MRDIHEELVDYQSPLLRMKIWEIQHNSTLTHPELNRKYWHHHPEAEFVLLLDGEMDFYIEQEVFRLTPGKVVIVGPSQLHTGSDLKGNNRQIVFQYDLKLYLDSFASPYSFFFTESSGPLSRLNHQLQKDQVLNDKIAQAILEIYEESQALKIGFELAVSMHMKQIMLTLLRFCGNELRMEEFGALEAIMPILSYVDHHYSEKIDLHTASRLVNMSYSYVSRLFPKAIGMNFTEYVNRKRIQAAQRLLITSDMNITDIGAAVGISNPAHFFKIFKQLNDCSPSQFRKTIRKQNN